MRDRGGPVCFGVGLLLCIGIWVAVPYNNFALNNSFVSDGYLPEIVLLCIALMVLVINPLLRLSLPRFTLSHRQLALITGMMLFAAVLPSNGLLRFFPHCLALDTQQINMSAELAEAIRDSALPASLFPDAIGPDLPTPVSDQLIDVLDRGETIPWGAWLPPLLSWGVVIAGFWLMMLGLGSMVYPQWRHNERLPFPLLRVYHGMIDPPEAGKWLPPLLCSKLFWVGCGLVVALHSFNGLALFTDGAFPSFPISWNISAVFTEGVWAAAPGFLKQSRIYFLFFGLAYFMPTRYSFSIWFTVLFFGLVVMFTRMYAPWFDTIRLYDQGCGALIAISIGVIWLGRTHYLRVMKLVFRRAGSEDEKTDALAGRLFLVGCLVMLGWFIWAGAGWIWSPVFVVVGVMTMLLVARIVAETGLTYVWIIPLTASRLTALVPQRWTSVSTAFLQEAHLILANRASAVSAAVMMMMTLGLWRHSTPGSRRRMTGVGMGVLLLGLLVCGAVHLRMGYTMATSFDGLVSPITGRGARLMGLQPVKDLLAGRENVMAASQVHYILFGIALAGALLFLCARFPGWPLHPIGLIFVHSSIGLRLIISLFLGWVVKALIVRYGGARAYRSAAPLFLGFILGEMLANVVWTLVPVVQILLGADPTMIEHMIIFQYT